MFLLDNQLNRGACLPERGWGGMARRPVGALNSLLEKSVTLITLGELQIGYSFNLEGNVGKDAVMLSLPLYRDWLQVQRADQGGLNWPLKSGSEYTVEGIRHYRGLSQPAGIVSPRPVVTRPWWINLALVYERSEMHGLQSLRVKWLLRMDPSSGPSSFVSTPTTVLEGWLCLFRVDPGPVTTVPDFAASRK